MFDFNTIVEKGPEVVQWFGTDPTTLPMVDDNGFMVGCIDSTVLVLFNCYQTILVESLFSW